MPEYLCECCGKNKATVKDFRQEGYSKYLVCNDCFNLADVGFFRKMKATKRRKYNQKRKAEKKKEVLKYRVIRRKKCPT